MSDKTYLWPIQPAAWDDMTLRDWFAGQSLIGIIQTCAHDTREPGQTVKEMFAENA